MLPDLVAVLAIVLLACLAAAPHAAAKEFGTVGTSQGLIEHRDGAAYRYVTVNPQAKPTLTIVERIDMGDGTVDRWWYLRGNYFIPAVAFDGSPGGLSANGNALALVGFSRTYPPRQTKLAILDTDVYLRHPIRPGQQRPRHAIRRVTLPAYFAFQAISPSGSKLYLRRYRPFDHPSDDFALRVLNARNGKLALARSAACRSAACPAPMGAGPTPSMTATNTSRSCSPSTPPVAASSASTCPASSVLPLLASRVAGTWGSPTC